MKKPLNYYGFAFSDPKEGYNEHFHTVDNTTGCCVTCGENIDNSDKKSKLIFNQDYYGEDLNDIVKDITFMYDNEVLKDIPDDQGILQGKFNVTITWSEE